MIDPLHFGTIRCWFERIWQPLAKTSPPLTLVQQPQSPIISCYLPPMLAIATVIRHEAPFQEANKEFS
jgi:hypothetical protein